MTEESIEPLITSGLEVENDPVIVTGPVSDVSGRNSLDMGYPGSVWAAKKVIDPITWVVPPPLRQ